MKLRSLVMIVVVMMGALGTLPAAAQSGVLQPGTLPVQVAAGTPSELTYQASPGETISLSAASVPVGAVDPTLEVLSAAGVRLAFNDDHGGLDPALDSFGASIRDLLLPDGGPITVRVGTFNNAGAGTVQLTFASTALGSVPTPIPASSGASLTGAAGGEPNVEPPAPSDALTNLPASYSGEVPRGGEFTGTIIGAAGEVVTITVRALDNALDPKVDIIDAVGVVIATNDDHGTSDASLGLYDSLISNFALPSAGTYTIRVDGYGNTSGRFEMSIDRVTGGSLTNVPTPEPIVIAQGDTQTVSITVPEGDVFAYEFPATAGDVYVMTVRAADPERDPFLIVRGQGGSIIAWNDDQGGLYPGLAYYDSVLANLIIPETMTYVLEIGEYADAGGVFDLTLTRIATGAPTTRPTQEAIRGIIEPNGLYAHQATFEAGEYVTILVNSRSDDFDTRVALYSPDGVLLAENDDHSSELDELIPTDSLIRNVIIPVTGVYTIEISGYQESSGEFNLLIRRPL